MNDEHELHFWNNASKDKNEWNNNFRHRKFYEFFNLEEIEGNILEVGCGGMPIDTYYKLKKEYKLDLLDPIIEKIITIPEYNFLSTYQCFSDSAQDFKANKIYDNIVMVNCLDHIEGYENQIETIKNLSKYLKQSGKLYIYYDIRDENCEGHYAISQDKLMEMFLNIFEIEKVDYNINPKHIGWGNVVKSFRSIMIKK